MSIQLEVGKTYVTRDGRHYLIDRFISGGDELYPFKGKCVQLNSEGRGYLDEIDAFTPSGKWNSHVMENSRYDLMAEVVDANDVKEKKGEDMSIQPFDPAFKHAAEDALDKVRPRSAMPGMVNVPFIERTPTTKEASDRSTAPVNAEGFLRDAAETMAERGKQYDSPQGERSMGKTVQAFNTITGQDLTEAQGWLFMSVLKKVRQYQAGAHLDSCVDDVAYTALFAEARMQENQS